MTTVCLLVDGFGTTLNVIHPKKCEHSHLGEKVSCARVLASAVSVVTIPATSFGATVVRNPYACGSETSKLVFARAPNLSRKLGSIVVSQQVQKRKAKYNDSSQTQNISIKLYF